MRMRVLATFFSFLIPRQKFAQQTFATPLERGIATPRFAYDLIGVAIMLTVFGLAGCTGADAPAESAPFVEIAANEPIIALGEEIQGEEERSDPAPEINISVFYFPLGNVNIHLGANINEIKSAIGEPIAEFKMPSCAFEGTDIVYRFPGVQVHTIPIDGANFIHTIAITDDTVGTAEGIMLGSGFDDMIGIYGYDYVREYGMYTFTRKHTSISFFIADGMVVAITYELDVKLYFEVN